MMISDHIKQLMQKQHLTSKTCQQIFSDILQGKINSLQTMAFLVLLRTKGETAEEVVGLVNALKSKMVTVSTRHRTLDIVGTGGDGAKTVNISTGSAILAASCGVKIAKHGNRSVSSLSGSADVLEALGINIHLSPDKISKSIDDIGIAFCFAPLFHPTLAVLQPLRRELQVPTSLNLLGPLLNPANPAHYLLGIYDERIMNLMAQALQLFGTRHSFIMHGGGLDEVSCVAPIKIIEVKNKELTTFNIDAVDYGFARCRLEDLRGGDAKTNAGLLRDALSGKKKSALADSLILNVAVALYVYGRYQTIKDAIPFVREKLYDGSALQLLNKWIEYSHD